MSANGEEEAYTVRLTGKLSERWLNVGTSPWAAARGVLRGEGDSKDQEWDETPEAWVEVGETYLRVLPDEDSFEVMLGPYYFHIRREADPADPEGEPWTVDQFLAGDTRGHINTETFATLTEAVQAAVELGRGPPARLGEAAEILRDLVTGHRPVDLLRKDAATFLQGNRL